MLPSLALAVSAAVLVASRLLGAPDAPARAPAGHAAMPHVAPESVGMSAERLALIDRVVGHAIEAGGFPGAAVIVGRRGAIVWERGYGTLGGGSTAAVDPERTLYDVASLTKVVATSAAAMVLVDQGRLGLDDPVARHLPEFRGGARARVTVRHLLTHRSGLPAGRALPRGATPAAARRVVLRTPLEGAPGARQEYSDLGPVVLGLLVERVTGESLDRFVARAVYAPLGMRSTTFRPSRAMAARIAPTGRDVPRGAAHDRTARALGGVAGHAGVFAPAGDLAVFAQLMLERGRHPGGRLVHDSTVAVFTRPGAGWRALGWQTCSGGGSCGRLLGPTAYGHTGFTGTSLWVDPERELFVIVLTNWVAGRAGGGVAPVAVLHDVRADVADLAALAVVDGDAAPAAMPDRMRSDARNGW